MHDFDLFIFLCTVVKLNCLIQLAPDISDGVPNDFKVWH